MNRFPIFMGMITNTYEEKKTLVLEFAHSAYPCIMFVDRIPEMERSNGFSWAATEKGIFKDSLTETKVYVFVDDLRQQKIRLVHDDSLKVFLNFKDSLETQKVYHLLNEELMANLKDPN